MQQETEITCKLQVFLWNQKKADLLAVNNNITISDIIKFVDGNEEELVVFTDCDLNKQTPIIDYNKTLFDYNMWFPNDKYYIAEIHLYKKKDVHLYNEKRYNMFLNSK
jgi:hypothetical protein